MTQTDVWWADADLPPADWKRYRGSNYERFAGNAYKYRNCGEWRFSDFIGKPLDEELWAILMLRVKPWGLWILGPDEERWSLSSLIPVVILYLDDQERVRDVGLNFCV